VSSGRYPAHPSLRGPRITAELNDERGPGERINHKRVTRVMREHAFAGGRLRRKVRPCQAEPSGHRLPDPVKRDVTAAEPGCRDVGDITYLPIADGSNLYLATVIGLFSASSGRSHTHRARRDGFEEHSWRARGLSRGRSTPTTGRAWRLHVCGLRQAALRPGSPRVDVGDRVLGGQRTGGRDASLKREVPEGATVFVNEPSVYRAVFRWAVRDNTGRRHSAGT